MALYIVTWFFIGFFSGLMCSFIDLKFNNNLKFEVKTALLYSPFGLLLFLFALFYLFKNIKKDQKQKKYKMKNFDQ